MQNILIIEDEIKIAELLNDYMKDAGYTTQLLHHGDDVLPWLKHNNPDLILLDLMLPGLDGLEICKQIKNQSSLPIIMVTAKVDEIDRLIGLELGADDYICKPFSPREVVARVKAVLKRSKLNNNDGDTVDTLSTNLQLNEKNHNIEYKNNKTELTVVEFRLFKILYNNPGHIYSRDTLMSHIYEDHRVVIDRTVDSHIKKIRKKLELINIDSSVIHSVYGMGYKYE